ncbi:MAG: PQQ-dependent sugar dehydrogenase [Candidatus Eiseniibacteriota bacterium]
MTRRFGTSRAALERATWLSIALAGLATLAASLHAAPPAQSPIAAERVAEGLDRPLYVTAPAGDARLFVVEQGGRVRVVRNGRLLPQPYLDLSDRVSHGSEQGLLSIAFHPRYARNGMVYVNYTDRHGDTRIERYHVSADSDRAEGGSMSLVLSVKQPYANHNGGLLLFGPDGMLYVGMGDGGSGGDPEGNAQNPASLLGKLLRLDVDHAPPYAVPPDNPFVGRSGYRPEIWALGLRNPWRYCFDWESNLLVIADVGQNQWEEIDAVPARVGGWNFGWNRMEGRHVYRAATAASGTTPPVDEYGHDRGCSVIGGFVYRGRAIASIAGLYFYSDYCDGRVRAERIENFHITERAEWNLHLRGPVSSFGLDAAGELYITTLDGTVYRIVKGH